MKIHIVNPGESLYTIAREYGVPEARILCDNALETSDKLIPGQSLLIGYPKKTYTVRGGDTPKRIAERNKISLSKLLQNNPHMAIEKLIPSECLALEYDHRGRSPLIVNAYTGNADFSQVSRALPYLSALTIENRAVVTEDGVKMAGSVSDTVGAARAHRVLPVLALESVNERGMFDCGIAESILSDPNKTERFIQSAVCSALENGFGGIEVHLPMGSPATFYRYSEMMLALSGCAREHELTLSAAICPTEPIGKDGAELLDTVDYASLWTYIWDDAEKASPVAPMDLIRKAMETETAKKYAKKLLLGLPTFGMEYLLCGKEHYSKKMIPCQPLPEIARRSGCKQEFDPKTQTASIRYHAEQNDSACDRLYTFEDARTIQAKLSFADEMALGGVNIMSLEYDFPVLYGLLCQQYDILKF